MTTIVCRSAYLASELAAITGADTTVSYPAGMDSLFKYEWLTDNLKNNSVSLVVYEPRFFVDPAPFRAISPQTQFVVLGGPGDDLTVELALICGASAVIEKPFIAQDVRGVLALVSF